MEKKISDDEIKDLEDEIDSAVDRLFRDKTRELQDYVLKEPTGLESSPVPTKGVSPGEPEPIERLETQLLQLEWDVTGENLLKTEEEVQVLRKECRENPRMSSILGLMERVLKRMIEDSDRIEPSLIKFLLDSKDTLKLLLRDEGGEVKTYQQLACDGLEARFSLMEEVSKRQPEVPFSPVEIRQEAGPAPGMWEKIEEMFHRIRDSSEKVEGILSRIEGTLLRLPEGTRKRERETLPAEGLPVSITVFKAIGRLFGVENEKVYKVFRIPETFQERYSRAEKIRLKDVEVRMIDLRRIFSMEGGTEGGEGRILLVRDNGGYKGFRVEQILKKLSAPVLRKGVEHEGYCTGTVQWRYEDHPVEIPVLDLKKF